MRVSKKLEAAKAVCRNIRPGTECQDHMGGRRLILTPAIDEKTTRVLVVYAVKATGQTLLTPDDRWNKERTFSQDAVGPDTVLWKRRPKPGDSFRNGDGRCRVVATALDQKTGRPYVIYKCAETGTVWACQIERWLERFVSLAGRPAG